MINRTEFNEMPQEKEVLNTDEAASFLGLEKVTLLKYFNSGVIPGRRVSKKIVLFHKDILIKWLTDAQLPTVSG